MCEQKVRRESAQHVLGAMREVDDVEHAEDHGEAEAEQRVERAVDQPEQQLPEQCLRGNAEDFKHGAAFSVLIPPPERGRGMPSGLTRGSTWPGSSPGQAPHVGWGSIAANETPTRPIASQSATLPLSGGGISKT